MSYDATALFVCGFGSPKAETKPLESGSLVSVPALVQPAVELQTAAELQPDEELLLQVCNGSREALALLFRRHASSVLSVARRILRDDAEAEDLLQEMFLFVYQKASHFDASKASALSWLIQMTYHRAIDRRRFLNTRQHYVTEEFQDDLQRPNHAQQWIDDIAGRELLDKFRNELTTEQQQTLELHFFEGYTFHEIAEKTGQTLGNVRHHYYRGLERLRSFVFSKKRD